MQQHVYVYVYVCVCMCVCYCSAKDIYTHTYTYVYMCVQREACEVRVRGALMRSSYYGVHAPPLTAPLPVAEPRHLLAAAVIDLAAAFWRQF